MAVLIKGMEMPKDCTECWFRKTARHEYLSDCQICPFSGETTPYTKRKDDCPLVPVPPHKDVEREVRLRFGFSERDNLISMPFDGFFKAEEGE